MGIYGLSDFFYLKKNFFIDQIKNTGIKTIAIDIENIIGLMFNKKFSEDYILKTIHSYYEFFSKNNINCFLIFRDDNIIESERESLKKKKTILKSFTNQNSTKITEKIQSYLWNETMKYIKENPIPINHKLFEFYEFLFYKKNDLWKYWMENNNRRWCLKELGKYVWKNNEKYNLYIKSIVEENKIQSKKIPKNLLWEIAEYNYKYMCEKRLTTYVNYIKKNISSSIPVIYTKYDPDDFIVMMKRIGLIDAVFSQDSDFIPSNVDMITDVDINNKKISVFFIDDFYKECKNYGFNRNQVNNALIFSSADYNYVFYQERINFKESIYNSLKNNNFDTLYKYFCNKYKQHYDAKTSFKISNSYKVYIKPTVVIQELYNNIINNDNMNNNDIFLKMLKILLSSINDNNILSIENTQNYIKNI